MLDGGEAGIAGYADIGRAGCRGFLEEIVAERRQTCLIGEVGDLKLAEALHGCLAVDAGKNLAGLVDDDLNGIDRYRDGRNDTGAIHCHQLAGGVGVEGAGAGVERAAIGALDLEPASTGQCHVETVAGAGEFALGVHIAHGRRLDAEADRNALRHQRGIGAVGHALRAVDLVEQVGEFGARPLVAGGVDVGDVVGDDFQICLLGIHAGGGDGKCFHALTPQIPIRLTSR